MSKLKWLKIQQLNGNISSKLNDLIVMGCSAGSIATQVWGGEIIKKLNYPTHSAFIMDSYVGLFPLHAESDI
jgi:hypothetical protein